MTQTLWTIHRVSLAGREGDRLVDVSLSIPTGITAIVGESGAGKTSLLNLLVGYEQPRSGHIVRGESPSRSLPVFWSPQDDGLWPRTTVREHLKFVQPAPAHELIDELLQAFDLDLLADATPERLSRGEASRVAIARAIASEAHVLVLDEPLSHVDPVRRSKYWMRLLRSAAEREASIVFASHEPADVLRYAQHAVGVHRSRVVYVGDVDTLYTSPRDRESASLLGPANWLTEADRSVWKISGENISDCVRPERLRIEPTEDGQASVIATRSAGSIDETDLRFDATLEVHRFLHRPASERLTPGQRVRLTILALLAAMLFSGCDRSAEGPQLKIASERRISLPVKGADLPGPRAVAVGRDDEKIVLDNAGRVLVYDAKGELVRQWDMPESSVGNPEGVCVLADGRICVADTHYHRVVFFDPQGNVTGMFGELGREPSQFKYPVAVTVDPSGNLYVAEYGENDRIQKFNSDNTFLTAFGSFGTGEGQFQRPSGIAWLEGKIYCVDAFNSRVHVFADSGDYQGLLDTHELGLHYPYDLSLGPDRRLYIVEYGAGRVTVLEPDGKVVGRTGSTGSGEGHFATPWGLAVDSKGRIWVADTGNRRIVEIVPQDAEGSQPLGFIGGTR